MRSKIFLTILGAFCLSFGVGATVYAQEAKSPVQFQLGILAEHTVSFVLPSALIVDERGRTSGISLTITNYTKIEQGFTIDKLHLKEVLKPGETKTVKLSATDLDAIGTDQSVFPYYNHLDAKHIGGMLYIKR